MKKFFLAVCCCVTLLGVSSCSSSVTTPSYATANPVGNKCGEATYKTTFWGLFGKRNVDVGINAAAKKGGITKISHVDSNKKSIFFGFTKKYTTRVYGE